MNSPLMNSTLRCVIVVSTGGSVMNELLKNEWYKNQIHSVISDRKCPGIDKAEAHGVPTRILKEPCISDFCLRLREYLQENKIDYVFLFYTRLIVGPLLSEYEDHIINLHPSLLPSFKGMDGFGDTIAYGARYVGSTIHFIDENMDEGKIIMQTSHPVDKSMSVSLLRHIIFRHQCKSLLQVMNWLSKGRVVVEDGLVTVKGANYNNFEFSPALDFESAVKLEIPFPNVSG